MSLEQVAQTLLRSKEPSVRWKVRVHILGENPESKRVRDLAQQVRQSRRVRALLAHRDSRGRLRPVGNPYSKWQGAHWVLATLADIGYPRADRSLLAMGDQVLDRWLADVYYREFDAKTEADAYRGVGVPRMRGRYRRCASQQGNALYFLTKLGLADGRVDAFVERLLHWQWPDGGWNCDKHPSTDTSSFWDSRHGWKARAEFGGRADRRWKRVLNFLKENHLPGGGWAAEGRRYPVSSSVKPRAEYVDWGGAGTRKRTKGVRPTRFMSSGRPA